MAGPSFQIIILLLLLIAVAVAGAAAQPPPPPNPAPNNNSYVQATFRPSIAVVIGIFAIMFSLTFLLLMYGKFCHSNGVNLFNTTGINISGSRSISDHNIRSSGIDKAVIESLPFFRFSALKGSRQGLECSVCLSRFDDAELLRLLPRCNHAFHMDCIDRWLDSHSSCPLCRIRVDADDIAFFKFSSDSQRNPTEITEDSISTGVGLELYVERENASSDGTTSRLMRVGKQAAALHNLKHRVLVSQVVFRSRWSDFNSADLISLDSEMLRATSSRMVECGEGSETIVRIKEEMERKRRLETRTVMKMEMGAEECSGEDSVGDMRALISPGSRCMSDITVGRSYRLTSYGDREERVRQMWLPIARRTVQWFAGKEGRGIIRLHGGGGEREENV